MNETKDILVFARAELLAAADALYDREMEERRVSVPLETPWYKGRQRAIDAAAKIRVFVSDEDDKLAKQVSEP